MDSYIKKALEICYSPFCRSTVIVCNFFPSPQHKLYLLVLSVSLSIRRTVSFSVAISTRRCSSWHSIPTKRSISIFPLVHCSVFFIHCSITTSSLVRYSIFSFNFFYCFSSLFKTFHSNQLASCINRKKYIKKTAHVTCTIHL